MTNPKTHTCDCLNNCGDDERLKSGRVTPCPHGAKRQAENRQTETLNWVNPTHNTMPDAMELVLLEREAAGSPEPVSSGFWDGHYWCNEMGDLMTGKVTGWAAWPNGRVGGARHV
jgi:hypothetical protein